MADASACEPVLSAKAAAFLVGLSKRGQRRLIDLLFQLAEDPHQIGDYSESDDTGSEIQFLPNPGIPTAFGPDPPVKELRFVEIGAV